MIEQQLTQAINEMAFQLRLLEKQIPNEPDWLKAEALKSKHKKLDAECLNLINELNLITEDTNNA